MITNKFKTIVWIFVYLILGFETHALNNNKVPDPLCGPKNLLKICELMKVPSSLQELCELTGYNKNTGTTMLGLYQAAVEVGLPAVPVKIDLEQLCNIDKLSIAFVDGNHFLIIHSWKGDRLLIQNPPDPPFFQLKKVFKSRWNGEVLVFSEKLKKQMESQIAMLSVPFKGPSIKFDKTHHNFETVDEGKKISHTFTFTNIGTKILEVNARSTCSCTAAILSNKKIPAGGNGKIKLEFDTKGKKGLTKQSVHVRTNDPNNKYVTLTISAKIKPSVKVVPERIWLDEIVLEENISREILVIGLSNNTLKIKGIETPEGITSKILTERSEDIRAIPIQLNINSGNTPGKFEKKITIHTNDPKRSEIIIPISGIVLPEVRAFPPAFFFGEIIPNTTVVREVIISSTKGESLKQIIAKPTSPFVKTEVKTTDDESKYKILAILRAPKNDITIRDNIHIYIKSIDNATLKIPLYARVIKKK